MKIIKLFVALIWSVIGLIIWLPILFRVMFIYIFNICVITITENDLEEKKHLDLLVKTGSIYINGFKSIFMEYDGKIIRPKNKETKRNYWLELLWAIIFWSTIILPLIL
jgi:hypothetical protein